MIAVQSRGPPGQPDIGYAPDLDKYLARVQRRLKNEKLKNTLPSGFPAKLESDLVWDGASVQKEYDWTYALNDAEVDDIENGLKHFQTLNISLGEISAETFPLPVLRPALRRISKELHQGHGFSVLRGLPVTKHTREENVIIYAGVSSHVAPDRGRQDHQYEGKTADVVLNHIKNLSNTPDAHRIGAPAYTTDKQVFHTDAGHIVSLFALDVAAKGGQSKLASSWYVYNELAGTRPDLIQTLSEPWDCDGFGNPQKPFTSRPLLYITPPSAQAPQRLIIQYARRVFTGFQALPRSTDIPPITEAQAEALDALHFTAEKHAVSLDFRQGDVQYVNNLSIFHARDSFEDTDEQQRHLLRLWLRDPEYAWAIPEGLSDRFSGVYDNVTPEAQVFPLEPRIRSSSDGVKAPTQASEKDQ